MSTYAEKIAALEAPMSGPRIVIVCGGRDYADFERVRAVLDSYRDTICWVIQGGARGADTWAHDWALANDCVCVTVEADWKRWGAAAGPRRNRHMLAYQPDTVIAFPGGKGTADMVRQARKAGVRVVEIPR